jgi:hypothetical protein
MMGHAGWKEFRRKRLVVTKGNPELDSNGYGGCFHDGECMLDVVEDTHDEALAKAMSDAGVYNLLQQVRSLAEYMLKRTPDLRPKDISLYDTCQRIIKRADKLAGSELASATGTGKNGIGGAIPLPTCPVPELRIQPPELPPDDDAPPENGNASTSASEAPGELLPMSILQVARSGTYLQAPSSTHRSPQDTHAANGHVTADHVRFAEPPRSSAEINRPALTVDIVQSWIEDRKERINRTALTTLWEDVEMLHSGRDQVRCND